MQLAICFNSVRVVTFLNESGDFSAHLLVQVRGLAPSVLPKAGDLGGATSRWHRIAGAAGSFVDKTVRLPPPWIGVGDLLGLDRKEEQLAASTFFAIVVERLVGWARECHSWIPLGLRMSGDTSHFKIGPLVQILRPVRLRLASCFASVGFFGRSGQTLRFRENRYFNFNRKDKVACCGRVEVS